MNKDNAAAFLNLIIAGKIDEAYDTYVDFSGKHHNVYTETGFNKLKAGMKIADAKNPNMAFTIKNVFGGNDLVAVHSHLGLSPTDPGMSVVHMFRFNNDKIVEMWDVAQAIPKESPNSDGAF